MAWSLHDAKNRLSQLVREAQDAPQTIKVRGEERAVVLSPEAYRKLTRGAAPGLRAFLQASPWAEVELVLTRDADAERTLDLSDDAVDTGGAQAKTA